MKPFYSVNHEDVSGLKVGLVQSLFLLSVWIVRFLRRRWKTFLPKFRRGITCKWGSGVNCMCSLFISLNIACWERRGASPCFNASPKAVIADMQDTHSSASTEKSPPPHRHPVFSPSLKFIKQMNALHYVYIFVSRQNALTFITLQRERHEEIKGSSWPVYMCSDQRCPSIWVDEFCLFRPMIVMSQHVEEMPLKLARWSLDSLRGRTKTYPTGQQRVSVWGGGGGG